MKRIMMITVAALALAACNRDGPVDPAAMNAGAAEDMTPTITQDVKAYKASEAKPVVHDDPTRDQGYDGLDKLTIKQLNEAEAKCIASSSDTCETAIDAEFHRRGWCAYDATGARKPHCTKAEIDADLNAETQLP